MKSQLLSTTLIPAFVGAGMFIASSTVPAGPAQAATPATSSGLSTPLPTAKPRPRGIQIAAGCSPCNPCAAKNPCNPCAAKNPCNPCAAKNPCNPCAAKNPCNPCAANNPCNPCGAKKSAYSSSCFIPSLRKANPCNPCAAKNPCNPCAAKNPCNPCAAKNPCNPCAAKNPCNPCAAKNPCNPCAAKNPCNPCAAKNPCNPCAATNPCNPCAASNPCAAQDIPEITPAEAIAAYNCLNNDLAAGYAKSNLKTVAGYQKWVNVNTSPYQSATHGNRYVNNYANDVSASRYKKFEEAGVMPKGSVLAKDSFGIKHNGAVEPGPLFVMEKMNKGYNKSSGDWKFTIIMPDGNVAGTTKGNGLNMQFCVECHVSVTPELDYIMFLPEEFRK